jgi:hypothetical protein
MKDANSEAYLVAKCFIFASFSRIDLNLKKVRRKIEIYRSNPDAYQDMK